MLPHKVTGTTEQESQSKVRQTQVQLKKASGINDLTSRVASGHWLLGKLFSQTAREKGSFRRRAGNQECGGCLLLWR